MFGEQVQGGFEDLSACIPFTAALALSGRLGTLKGPGSHVIA